jgi:ABC-2 type transport system permease protein
MRRALLIAKRDYLATIRTKAFIVGLIVAPLLFGGGFVGVAIWRAKPDIKEKRIAVLDRSGVLAIPVIQAATERNVKELFDKTTGRQVKPRYLFESFKPMGGPPERDLLALSDRVRRGELAAFLEIGPEALHPGKNEEASRIGYYANAGGIDELRIWLSGALTDGLRRARLVELGVAPEHFKEITESANVEGLSLVTRDARTGAIQAARKKSMFEGLAVPYAMTLLLMMIAMVGVSPMMAAVTEDKSQRVVEVLLGAASPFELMIGKVIASVGVSLTSSSFYILGGTFALYGMGMIGMAPLALYPWFYAYLICDVVMLCAIGGAVGAACNSPQEMGNLAILVLSPLLLPSFFLLPITQQPNGVFATAMSLFPPFTPMLMMLRQAMPSGIPAWQPWVGIFGVLVFTVGAVWVAARIFRVAILMQGKAPTLGELARMARRG